MSDFEYLARVQAAQSTLDAFQGQDFVWGSCDCAHMAAHAIEALGNANPLDGFAPYNSRFGALRSMIQKGQRSFEDHLSALGYEEITTAWLLPADIVGMPSADTTMPLSLGVYLGQSLMLAFIDMPDGRQIAHRGPSRLATKAWRNVKKA